MTIGVLRTDLDQVCSTLHWISDGAVCGSLQGALNRAVGAAQRGDRAGVTDGLHAILEIIDAQHGAGMSVNDNAYWLLKVNAEYLLAHV